MIKLPEQLKQLRASHHLSQDDLAKELFVSRQTISKWENGESTPDLNNLVTLANRFEVSLDELIIGKSPSSERIIERIIEKEIPSQITFYDFVSDPKNRWLVISILILLFIAIMNFGT